MRFLPYAMIGLKNLGISIEYHVLQKTMSLSKILSSKVARKEPGYAFSFTTRLIEPLIPETVLKDAPVNLATSTLEVNIPLMKAVFFITL